MSSIKKEQGGISGSAYVPPDELETVRKRVRSTREQVASERNHGPEVASDVGPGTYRDPAYAAASGVAEVPGSVVACAKNIANAKSAPLVYMSIVRPDNASFGAPFDAMGRNTARLNLGDFFDRNPKTNLPDGISQSGVRAALFSMSGKCIDRVQYLVDVEKRLAAETEFEKDLTTVAYVIPLNDAHTELIAYLQNQIATGRVYTINEADNMYILLELISGMHVSAQRSRGDIDKNLYVVMDGLLWKVRTHGAISRRCVTAMEQIRLKFTINADAGLFDWAVVTPAIRPALAQMIHGQMIQNVDQGSTTSTKDRRTVEANIVMLDQMFDYIVQAYRQAK